MYATNYARATSVDDAVAKLQAAEDGKFLAGGQTLLARHLAILEDAGVDEIVIGVGYRADLITAELEAIGAGSNVRTVLNPR